MAINKDQMKKDKILSVGLKIRQNSHVLFYFSCIATFFGLLMRYWLIDILVVIFIGYAWHYKNSFRLWELKNKEYIESKGFEVKG